MAFFFVCFALGWITIGAAIITRINRAEFVAQTDRGQRSKNYRDDSEFKELLRSEGAAALCMMLVFTLVFWPIVLYIMIKDGRK